MIDEEKLRLIYASMLKVRLLRNQSDARRGTRKRSRRAFSEACEVGCTVDLRSQDTIAVSPEQSFARVIRRSEPLQSPGNATHEADRAISLNVLTYEDSAERITLATGIAFADRVQKNNSVVVAFADGEDASAIHRSAQFAFQYRLPVLYVQRLTAASPRKSRSKKPSQVPTIPVDQNDAIAVYRVAYEAIDKARRGVGPTIIEAIESRTPGPAARSQQQHDSLQYMEWYLRRRSLWSDELQQISTRSKSETIPRLP